MVIPCLVSVVAAFAVGTVGMGGTSEEGPSPSGQTIRDWHDWEKAEGFISVESQPDLPELHQAAGRGDAAAVKRLLEGGAEVDARDMDGWTALHWAAYEGQTEVVRLLLERGASADAEAYDRGGEVALRPRDMFPRATPETWVRVHKRVNKTPLKAALASGSKEAAEILLGLGMSAQAKNELLAWTLEYGYGGGTGILLDNGADGGVVDEDGWTLLHWAADRRWGSCVEALLERGADANARTKAKELRGRARIRLPADQTALHLGATKAEVVRALLEHGGDVKARDENGSTPLHKVWDNGEAAELLLQHGADANARDKEGETPLAKAMGFYYTGARDAILAHGGDVNAKNNEGKSLLHKAVPSRDLTVWLLDHGADPNAKDKDGRTPLHDVAGNTWWTNGADCAELLLTRGADAGIRDGSGATALDLAVREGNREVALFLRARGEGKGGGAMPLHEAAAAGDAGRVEELLGQGAEVNAGDEMGLRPLHLAVAGGHEEVVKLLLSGGAEVNAADRFGWTALHKAAWDGEVLIGEVLTDRGAEVNARAKDGDMPLHLAARRAQVGMATLLVDRGADVNAEGAREMKPLEWACCAAGADGVHEGGEPADQIIELLEQVGGEW